MELSQTEYVRRENIVDVERPEVARAKLLPGRAHLPPGQDVVVQESLESIDRLLLHLCVQVLIDGHPHKYLNELGPVQPRLHLAFLRLGAGRGESDIVGGFFFVGGVREEFADKVLLEVDRANVGVLRLTGLGEEEKLEVFVLFEDGLVDQVPAILRILHDLTDLIVRKIGLKCQLQGQVRILLPILEHRVFFVEDPFDHFVAQLFDQDGGILRPEIANRLMHGILKRIVIFHQIGVLASRHEQGQYVEVWASL